MMDDMVNKTLTNKGVEFCRLLEDLITTLDEMQSQLVAVLPSRYLHQMELMLQKTHSDSDGDIKND